MLRIFMIPGHRHRIHPKLEKSKSKQLEHKGCVGTTQFDNCYHDYLPNVLGAWGQSA
jgi:hypothetical protein